MEGRDGAARALLTVSLCYSVVAKTGWDDRDGRAEGQVNAIRLNEELLDRGSGGDRGKQKREGDRTRGEVLAQGKWKRRDETGGR